MPSSLLKRHIDDRVMAQARGQSLGHTGDWIEQKHKAHDRMIAQRNRMNQHEASLVPEARGLSRASLKRKKKKGVPLASDTVQATAAAEIADGSARGRKRMRAAAAGARGGSNASDAVDGDGASAEALRALLQTSEDDGGADKKKGSKKKPKGKGKAKATEGGGTAPKKSKKPVNPFADLEDMNAITEKAWLTTLQKKTNRVNAGGHNRTNRSAAELQHEEEEEEEEARAATLRKLAASEGVNEWRERNRLGAEARGAARTADQEDRFGGASGAAWDSEDSDDDDDGGSGGGGGGGWDGEPSTKPRRLMSIAERAADRSAKQRVAALARNAERAAARAAVAAAEAAKTPEERAAEVAAEEEAKAAAAAAAVAAKEAKAARRAAKKAARPSLKPVHLGGGLVVQDLTPGEGERRVEDGDSVQLLYVGTIAGSGKRFDRCTNPNRPFMFEVGAGAVIIGMNDGVKGMRAGQRRVVSIPPQMAYGRTVQKKIPQNSTLVFDITLQGFS